MMAAQGSNGHGGGKALSLDVQAGGIAIVTIDVPNEAVNTLGEGFARELDEILSTVESSSDIRSLVLVSGKKDNFLAGADVRMLKSVTTAEQATDLSRRAQQTAARLAGLRVPVVSAIHGACLGGGLELAVAGHARVATDHPKTRLGVPEVQLGVIPGGGGTQRLPRLIGLKAALDLILTGKQLSAAQAKSLGLVDEVVPPTLLLRAATELAASLADKLTAEPNAIDRVTAVFKHLLSEELSEIVLEDNPLGRRLLFDQAVKKLAARTHGNYPAPEKALDAVRTGVTEGMERGLEVEAAHFGELVVSPEARQLMDLFFATQGLKKDRGVADAAVRPQRVGKVGVLGAGLMGAGIAYANAALARVPVRLKDVDPSHVGNGLRQVRRILDARVRRHRISARARDEIMARVSGTIDYSGFHNVDLVVEAVIEDLELKRQVLREIEQRTSPGTIFASNTSTIPITLLAEASERPDTVIGTHYFSPVEQMPLIEVIATGRTAPWVTATCVDLGKRQGKTVIVVNDGVGFYTSRILAPYLNEALHILTEGVPIEEIDAALVQFGFPVGPIKLIDEVGIDVAYKAGGVVRAAFGDRIGAPAGMETLAQAKRYGRKTKRGFYRYNGRRTGVDESVYELLGIEPKARIDTAEIAARCALQMVNEAAHCFGEGVLRSARDGDVGAVFGLGFPPFRGGPFRYVDTVGAAEIVSRLDEQAARFGARFEPAPVLRELAASGGHFYAADGGARATPGQHGAPRVGFETIVSI